MYAAAAGDSSKVDLSVGDIYGGDYSGIGLSSNFIASSFGKLKDLDYPEDFKHIQKQVINFMIFTFNLGYCAFSTNYDSSQSPFIF